MKEPASETQKRGWKTHKATIYHHAMGIILQDIIAHSHTGFVVICGDGIQRTLYPCVPIESADYEEEYGFLNNEVTNIYLLISICIAVL